MQKDYSQLGKDFNEEFNKKDQRHILIWVSLFTAVTIYFIITFIIALAFVSKFLNFEN